MQTKNIRRLNLILMIIALCLLVVAGPVRFTYANADPGESAKATSESKNETKDSAQSKTTDNTKKESDDKNADTDDSDNKAAAANPADIIEENAGGTHGNASLGDAVKTSGQMDFYTIRTANNQTYYLVVDHSGAVDNVYLLSTIDANDLEDFVDSGAARNGGVVMLPDSRKDADDTVVESESEDRRENEKKKDESLAQSSRTTGLISLAVILAAGGIGAAVYTRSRKRTKEMTDYEGDNLEYDDGLPTARDED